jgi:hypothetical protein
MTTSANINAITTAQGTSPVTPIPASMATSTKLVAPALKKFRYLGSIPYSAGGTQQGQLAVGYKIRQLYLRIAGTATFSSASSIDTTGGIGGLIENLQLQLPGGSNLLNISGYDIVTMNFFRDNDVTASLYTGNATTTAPFTQTFRGLLRIDLAMNDQYNKVQTSLNARAFAANGLNMVINWASTTALSSAATSVTATVDVFGDENLGGINPSNIVTYEKYNLGSVSPGGSFQWQVNPASNKAIRAIMLHATNSNGFDVGFSCQDFSWYNGTVYSFDHYDADIATVQKLVNNNNNNPIFNNNISANYIKNCNNILDNNTIDYQKLNFLGGLEDLTSWKYIDIAQDKMLTEMFNTAGLANVSFAGKVTALQNVSTATLEATVINYLTAA